MNKVICEGKEYDLSKVIEQLSHPFAPAIQTIVRQGLKVTTNLTKGVSCTLEFQDSESLQTFLKAALSNQKQKGGPAIGFFKSLKPVKRSVKDTTFEQRRTAQYHFGDCPAW